jgi:hypothetical protein
MHRILIPFAIAAAVARGGPQPQPQPEHSAARAEPDIQRPLDWLVAAQNDDGSWGDGMKDQHPDVATTALAGMALLRTGSSGSHGAHQENTRRAVGYVVAAVERAPKDEVAVNPAGTLPQRKLGRNIDTFVAAQFLAEVLPTLPHGSLHSRAEEALASCVKRIEKAQAQDGSYSRDGWAPLLASAFASNGLYAAQRAGVRVDKQVLEKGQASLVGKYDDKSKSFTTADSAGVSLYSVAAGAMAAAQVEREPSAPPELKKHAAETEAAARQQLANEAVLRGFGSYGGEEHVSYMLTAEAKAALGGAEWAEFRKNIRQRLANIQRENGTWRGDHCITSTTFCTAASLITLAIEPKAGSRPS